MQLQFARLQHVDLGRAIKQRTVLLVVDRKPQLAPGIGVVPGLVDKPAPVQLVMAVNDKAVIEMCQDGLAPGSDAGHPLALQPA